MRSRTLMIAAMVLSVILIPSALAGDASADVSDPIFVKNGPLEMSVDSGGSADEILYVVSNSDSCLLLDASVSVSGEDVSASVTIDPLLYPGTPADPGVVVMTLHVEVGKYAASGVFAGTVVVAAERVVDIEPDLYELQVPFTVSVSSALASDGEYGRFFGIIPNTLDAPLDGAWFPALVTFLVLTLVTVAVSELVIPLFARLIGDRKTREEKRRLTNGLTAIITGIMVVYSIDECARILGAGPELLDLIRSVSDALFIIFGAMLAWRVYMFIVTAFLKGAEESDAVGGLDTSLLPLFKMVGRIGIAVSACFAVLSIFGVDLASIMISAGVITLGITLGAQSILGQFFSGIVLLATRPFRKGDYVLMDGETYVVERVRVMFTEFRNWSGDQTVTIPNDTVSKTAIRNVTRSDPWTRVFLDVTVAYGSDVEVCKRCLVEAACRHPHAITDGRVSRPSPRLQELGRNGITFRLAVWVDDYDDSIVYSGEIRELMYEELRSHGVEVPYERHQVEMVADRG